MNVFKNDNIKVSVKYEEGTYGDNGENGSGWTIYYSIYNYSDKPIKFTIKETNLYSNNAMRERDYYLTGYIITDFELPPKSSITGADIYLKDNGNFKVNDKFYIKLGDMTRAEEYKLFFEKVDSKNKSLKCISSEVTQNILLNPKLLQNQLKESIERIESFEEELGIKIENLSVIADDDSIHIMGDFFCDKMDSYYNLYLNTTYYDVENNIIGTESTGISGDDFLGFETFDIFKIGIDVSKINKIRLYPTVTKK